MNLIHNVPYTIQFVRIKFSLKNKENEVCIYIEVNHKFLIMICTLIFKIFRNGTKFTKELRMMSHRSYLPPLESTALIHVKPSLDYRSKSVPKLNSNRLSVTAVSPREV